jgi:cell division protein FtsW (lipid II flippase)
MEVLSLPDRISEYLKTAGEQIRWKRARKSLTSELESHLLEQKSDYIFSGMDESSAESEAIRQMGDPVTVGQELDRVHKPKPQWKLLLLVSLIAICGAFIRVKFSYRATFLLGDTAALYSLIVGLVLMFAVYFIDYSRLSAHTWMIYSIFVAVSASFPFLEDTAWVIFSGMVYKLQYVAYCYPLIHALVIYKLRGKGVKGLVLSILTAVPFIFFITFISSLALLITFIISDLAVLLTAINKDFFVKRKGLATGIILGFMAVSLAIFTAVHFDSISTHLSVLLHPELDPDGYGYQFIKIRKIISMSKLIGHGEEYTDLITWRGDYLMTLFIYEYGKLPFVALCCALVGFIALVAVKCVKQKNVLGRLVSLSIIITLGVQIIMSFLKSLGFLSLSVACPFIVGNRSSIISLFLTGILLSVFRQEELPIMSSAVQRKETKHPIQYSDGVLTITLKK